VPEPHSSARRVVHRVLAICAFAGVLLAPSGARADVVVLQNGDRITGKVTHKAGDVLQIETDYAGPLKIRWSQVQSIQTDAPVEVVRQGEEFSERTVLSGSADELKLDHIVYINPTPEEWGTSVAYRGRLNLSAAHITGNTNTNRGYAEGQFAAAAKKYRYVIDARALRENTAGVETAANWLVSGKRDRFIDSERRRFLYARSSFEHDLSKDIELRSTVGGGYGAQAIDSDITKLSIGAGLDAVWVNGITTPNERYPALGWDLRFSHWLGAKTVQVTHDQEGFWNLHDTRQVTLRTRTGLRVPVTKDVVAQASLNIDWERQPAPGRRPIDTTMLVGLGWEW
jgi:hypothetical protein